jgi:hypothetical protein
VRPLFALLGRSGLPRPRTSDLDAQPAVRHRLLLVAKRFEVTPLFESTHQRRLPALLGGGVKLEYHMNDMLSSVAWLGEKCHRRR